MLWESLLLPSQMGDPARTIIGVEGYELVFGDGNLAIDLSSGLWNVNFGYGNPCVANRIKQVVDKTHYSTLFRHSHPEAHEVAERLLAKVGWPQGALVFSTSGSALNDVIVKLASHWNALVGRERARLIVTIEGSYHGMTLNSMQLSGDELNQALYCGQSLRFVHLPPDDPEQWQSFFEKRGAMVGLVLLEPILGTGAIPLTDGVLQAIFEARRQYNFLLASDEVAAGFYRLGTIAASLQWSEQPDLIGFSKALTNGTEASSTLLISEPVAKEFISTDSMFVHGETQAGSPMTTAAILGVLDFIDSTDIESMYGKLEQQVQADLDDLAQKHGCKRRGQGLFQYLGFPAGMQNSPDGNASVFEVANLFRTHGVSVQPSIEGIQIIPAITMPLETWSKAVSRLARGLQELTQRSTS